MEKSIIRSENVTISGDISELPKGAAAYPVKIPKKHSIDPLYDFCRPKK